MPSSAYQPIDKSEEVLEEEKIKKAKKNTFAAFLGFSIPESLNFSTIFFMHFTKAFLDFLFNTPMRFIVFPCAAIYGLTKAGLLWRAFYLTYNDYKRNKATLEDTRIAFLQALWETLNGLGTTGAVITGIVGFFIGASVGMGISITFNFFLAASTAICAAYTGYYGYTAYQSYKEWKQAEKKFPTKDENDPYYKEFRDHHPAYIEFKERRNKAITNGIITGIVALLTVGVICAMVVGFPVVGAAIGIAGCLAGAAFSAYNLYKLMKNQPENKKPVLKRSQSLNDFRMPEEPNMNAKMHQKIGFKRTKSFNDLSPLDADSVIKPINITTQPEPSNSPPREEMPARKRMGRSN